MIWKSSVILRWCLLTEERQRVLRSIGVWLHEELFRGQEEGPFWAREAARTKQLLSGVAIFHG